MSEINSIIAPSADEAEHAAFRSIDAALRFAYGNCHRGEPDSLAKHAKSTGGEPRFEDADERAAWAGDIRRRIATLSDVRQAILIVRFAPRAFPCSCRRLCCSGWSRNEEWSEALSRVVEGSVQAVSGQISNRQLRAGIVRKWAGADRVNIGILADKSGMHRNTAGKQAHLIRKWLEQLNRAAMDDAALCLSSREVASPMHGSA